MEILGGSPTTQLFRIEIAELIYTLKKDTMRKCNDLSCKVSLNIPLNNDPTGTDDIYIA
jgi:hypothetical protein